MDGKIELCVPRLNRRNKAPKFLVSQSSHGTSEAYSHRWKTDCPSDCIHRLFKELDKCFDVHTHRLKWHLSILYSPNHLHEENCILNRIQSPYFLHRNVCNTNNYNSSTKRDINTRAIGNKKILIYTNKCNLQMDFSIIGMKLLNVLRLTLEIRMWIIDNYDVTNHLVIDLRNVIIT